jgi:N4-gp56 family major capsid protein
MPATLLADRPNEYEIYFSRLMLDHAIDEVHLADFAQLRPVPKNNGNQSVRFFRIPAASAANVNAVTEGVLVATSRKMVFEFVTITLSQFYDWVQVTDLVNDTEFNDTGEAVSIQFGEEAALWYDQQIRNLCCAAAPSGLTQMYTGGAPGAAVTNLAGLNGITGVTAALAIRNIIAAATQLRINRTPKVKTGPAKGSYAAVVGAQGQSDLFMDTNNTAFVQADAFAHGGKSIRSGWIDNLYGIGFFLSTNPFVELNATGLGVYNNSGTDDLALGSKIFTAIVTGKDSYGASALQGNTPWSPRVMVNGKPDKYDVIGQFVNFSWKAYAGWSVLQPLFGVCLRHKSQWKL